MKPSLMPKFTLISEPHRPLQILCLVWSPLFMYVFHLSGLVLCLYYSSLHLILAHGRHWLENQVWKREPFLLPPAFSSASLPVAASGRNCIFCQVAFSSLQLSPGFSYPLCSPCSFSHRTGSGSLLLLVSGHFCGPSGFL